ncbi:MAG: LacI family DNA-binding transcriptional regulator [Stackebrandtia sp.]
MTNDFPAEPGSSQVTLARVADHAEVSRQTVSNVLNAPHRVREATRQRVEAAIAELGYQPNRAARALRAQASRMIGYRIEPIREESLASIQDRFLHAVADTGRHADHHLLLIAADDPEAELASYKQLFRTGGVDGFVLSEIDYGDPRPAALRELGAPFAVFGRTGDDAGHCWADVDNAAGTAAAVDHLVERGHRRIGFVGWPDGSSVGDRRREGWHAALERHGLLAESRHLEVRSDDSVHEGAHAGRHLLERKGRPTAIVAVSDTLAFGAMQSAKALGVDVGEDLALVGFDDTPSARVLGLSSVRQPIEAIGRAIVDMLLQRLPGTPGRSDAPSEPESRLLAPALTVRASSDMPLPR